MSTEDLRKEYNSGVLYAQDLEENPLAQFRKWFEDPRLKATLEPNAMTLSTASKEGRPSSRMVLLKHITAEGLLFFTNYESRKALQMQENPFASVTFWWRELDRQVCMEGSVQKASKDMCQTFFEKRPKGSQLSAWASRQSCALESRELLEEKFLALAAAYEGKKVPLPPHWGGFLLVPTRFEFWQGRKDRLHDRFLYHLEQGKWHLTRLYP